ncbi:putative glutaredoxin domain family protein [Luminiphilus syltensis NOR5-1B]|uniref:Putative glutaredoxin domain family protein n=1 Tax=Luminiphilus syltensis NOR5-1B TaxID=565045 RepID=B8KYH1_9GAMM|nr:putative glutaredoxin domain family protein [Luminiphilus syltensis NOR5-1B]
MCEHAEAILDAEAIPFTPVDIAEDPELIERYGVRIPVVADDAGNELGWPFDATALRRFHG